MLITFLEDVKYSEDAFVVKQGHKGETRDVRQSAACQLLRRGKACNAEKPTGNEGMDKIMDDITNIICKKQSVDDELYNRLGDLMDMLRPHGSNTVQRVPNGAMTGFNANSAARAIVEDDNLTTKGE
jgi:hypothetical protein